MTPLICFLNARVKIKSKKIKINVKRCLTMGKVRGILSKLSRRAQRRKAFSSALEKI